MNTKMKKEIMFFSNNVSIGNSKNIFKKMSSFGLLVGAVLAFSISNVNAQATLPGEPGYTLAELTALQVPGYTFNNWRSYMTCSYVDYNAETNNQRVISFIAKNDTTIPTIEQHIANNTQQVNRGSWTQSNWNTLGRAPDNIQRRLYTDSTAVYNSISTTGNANSVSFSYTTDKGSRNVVLYPSGFYVTTNGTRYLPGC